MSLNFAEGEGGGARPPVASTPLERPIRAPARSARAILLFSVGHGRQGARVLLKRAHWVHLRRSLRVAVSRENARGMFKSKCTCVYVLCWLFRFVFGCFCVLPIWLLVVRLQSVGWSMRFFCLVDFIFIYLYMFSSHVFCVVNARGRRYSFLK